MLTTATALHRLGDSGAAQDWLDRYLPSFPAIRRPTASSSTSGRELPRRHPVPDDPAGVEKLRPALPHPMAIVRLENGPPVTLVWETKSP